MCKEFFQMIIISLFLVVTLEPISNDKKQRRASRVFILIEQRLQVFLVKINFIHY